MTPEQMKKLTDELREHFDYILLDCPAGIEQGFKNAIAGADRAIVVTTPEVSAIRDADRIIGLLESNEIKKIELLINRLPDDEGVVISTNQGEPLAGEETRAGQAFLNISRRIIGEAVPLMELSKPETFFSRMTGLFRKN